MIQPPSEPKGRRHRQSLLATALVISPFFALAAPIITPVGECTVPIRDINVQGNTITVSYSFLQIGHNRLTYLSGLVVPTGNETAIREIQLPLPSAQGVYIVALKQNNTIIETKKS